MKYFLIAGEASGDLHGAALMKSLKCADPQAEFVFFGGDLMEAEGGRLVKHYRELAFMGAIDVVMNLRTIARNLGLCKKELLAWQPDVAIMIDYPGFNLKMAEFAKLNHIRVFWFIAPKVWAWKEWRVKKLKAFVDELFAILPFEKRFFARHGMNVHYVGNPILDAIEAAKETFRTREAFLADNGFNQKPLVALLPGSRKQEIRNMLPVMMELAARFSDFQFVVAGSGSVGKDLYYRYSGCQQANVIFNQTYELLHFSHAAVVTSGTATLETALLNVPQLVLYRMAGGGFFYWLFRLLFLKVKFISLPNLILGHMAVEEFVMDRMKFRYIFPRMKLLLAQDGYRNEIFEAYRKLKDITGGPGAADKAARLMVEKLKFS